MKNQEQKTEGAFAIHNVSKRLFDVTYQGQDDKGLIVRTITVQAENASEAAEKVRECGLQLKIYSSNAC
tara:strand:- start:1390 stop:1596 length:207 start_codon:yes stop_codon:yes gene_type:complete